MLPLPQCQVHRHLDQGHSIYYPRNFIVLYSELVTRFTNDLTINFIWQAAISSLFYLLDRRNSERTKIYKPQIVPIHKEANHINKSTRIIALDSIVVCTNTTFAKEII